MADITDGVMISFPKSGWPDFFLLSNSINVECFKSDNLTVVGENEMIELYDWDYGKVEEIENKRSSGRVMCSRDDSDFER